MPRTARGAAPPGPTVFIAPGPRHLDLLNPSPRQIVPLHIATALAYAPSPPARHRRYASRAQHAVAALPACAPDTRLLVLLAPAPDAYLGRIPGPFHRELRRQLPGYTDARDELRRRLSAAILARLDAAPAREAALLAASQALAGATAQLRVQAALAPDLSRSHT